MRLVTFEPPDAELVGSRVGVVNGGHIVDLYAAHFALARSRGADEAESRGTAAAAAPQTMIDFFEGGERAARRAHEAVAFVAERFEAGSLPAGPGAQAVAWQEGSVRLLAPVPRPRRIRDYLTYEAHASGSGLAVSEAFQSMPICYECNTETIIGPDQELPWPSYTDQLDFELEIGFFTGRGGRNIPVAEADSYIAGVTIFNDLSARDIQLYEMSMNIGPSKGKSFGTVMGPCVLTMDEVDEYGMRCAARVNGETWMSGDTSGRRFSFAEVLAWASYCEPVYPGEFFAVGTVGGGCGLELDKWIRPGDVVELDVDRIGVLRNKAGSKENPGTKAGLASFTGAPEARIR